MEIWINPACSKCRTALSLLDEAGAEYTVRRYLDDPPSAAELEDVLGRLGLQPWDITRTGEQIAKDLGVGSWPKDAANRDRWLQALAAHPKLIQRPIIIASGGTPASEGVAGGGGHAVIARTDDAVRSVLPAS